jgi:putative intracellular protease/amidase
MNIARAQRPSSSLLLTLLIAALPVLATACAAPGAAGQGETSARETRRVAIVLTNHGTLGSTGKPTGFYLSEATHPHHVFRSAGYDVDFLSPKGGLAPMDGLDAKDAINDAFLADAALVARTKSTTAIRDADPARYDAVFFSGGHGTMWDFPGDASLQAFARSVYERGGVVAAVCHGPAALVNLRLSDGRHLVAGKQVAAFTNEEEAAVKLDTVVPFALESTLRQRGAAFVESPNFEARVAISDRLVTGQNPASATGAAEAVVVLLSKRAPELPRTAPYFAR